MGEKRLFRVIVLGGIALVGCGGDIVPQQDAGPAADASGDASDDVAFPSELPSFVDAGPVPVVDAGAPDGDAAPSFPGEAN